MKKLLFVFILLFLPLSANAARLYMDPAEGLYGPGDDIEVNIKLDVLEACINTIEAEILFPNDYLYIRDFITGDSIMSIWLEKPTTKDFEEISRTGVLKFSGGIPGGYCGKIPGDPGESNIVGKIVFTMPGMVVSDVKRDELEIVFSDKTRVLKNDGLGSEDTLLKQSAKFVVANEAQNSEYDWRDRLENDRIPPEPFVIELRRAENMFDNAYHLIFATVDKQTGLDHFEVLELGMDEQVGVKPETKFWEKFVKEEKVAPVWQVAEMPYVLKDQTLVSVIKVKALDKAGNERIVEYIPASVNEVISDESSNMILIMVLLIVGLSLLVLIVGLFVYKKHRDKSVS